MSIAAISRFVLSHKRLVAIVWTIVAIAGIASTGPATGALSERFDLPGRESTEANNTLLERYGNGGIASPLVAVVTLPDGTTVESPGVTDELAAAFDGVARAAPASRVVSYASTGDRAFVSDDGRTTFGLIFPRYAGEGQSPDTEPVRAALAEQSVAGSPFSLTGLDILREGGEEEGGGGVLIETLVGAVGALLVLLWVFGSLLAVLPLLIAGVSIVTTYLLVWGLTSVTDVSFVVQYLIALVGLGVAIDYSLLVVTRWREERGRGLDNATAVQRAMETAGHAVIFSGTTVAIGLLALVALPVPFLRSIGYGGMLIPLVSVLVSITLLPVLLATIGPRLDWPRLRRGDQVSQVWARWTRLIVRRRAIAATVGLVILAALLVPALRINIGTPSLGSLGTSGEAADGVDALERSGLPAGVLNPFEVLVTGTDPAAVTTALADVNGVASAVAPDGDSWRRDETAVVIAIPDVDGSTTALHETLDRVRDTADGLPGEVAVGGTAAFDADFVDAVYGSFPLMMTLIVVVTFILLVRAFRSIVLPLKAVILNVLSVAAAYGVLVLVWQEGYGSEAIWGIEATGAITNWLPVMVFAFLFGLSMDYEVFILSRMREEYDRLGDTDGAVIRGMSHTGRLVTAAAIILFLAFVSLAAVPSTEIKIMATGLAAGILLDATVIRGLLVPATVSLMGHWNWWLPDWLDRIVPRTDATPRLPATPHVNRAD